MKDNNYFIGCVAEFNGEELYRQQMHFNSGLTYDGVVSIWALIKEKKRKYFLFFFTYIDDAIVNKIE